MKPEKKVVMFTPVILKRFKKEVAEAERQGTDIFFFDDHEFYVGYAKHMIRYLEKRWERQRA